MISKDRLAALLEAELDAAIDLAQTMQGTRAQALAMYEGLLPANDDKDGDDMLRAAVSLDVADMVEAVYAQLAPALEDVGGIQFEATSAEDEAQAQKETEIVRSMLLEGYLGTGGFVALSEAIKDALLMRTGTLALWIDRHETRTPETWEDVPDMVAVGRIIAPTEPGQQVLDVNVDEMDDGEGLTVTLTRVDTEKRLAVGCVRPEDFVQSSRSERDPQALRFCADRVVMTRSAAVEKGFDSSDIADLPETDPEQADLYLDRTGGEGGREPAQLTGAQLASNQLIELWRCYVWLPSGEDSLQADRHRVWYSRDGLKVVSEPEKVGRVCYAVGNVTIYPHRADGVSLYDRLAEVQVLKSLGLRAWTENLHKVNRPRLGVDESLVNLADAADATQDIVRMRGPGGIVPIPAIDAGPSIVAYLAYQDQARSERGGASLDMQGAQMQIASNQTAQGIERQYSSKEQLAATMARTFAETALRACYQIAHYLLRTSWGGQLTARVAGQWVEEDPAQWRPRNGVSVRVGQSRTQRMERAAALAQVMSAQAALMQQGQDGVMVDASKMHNAASDWIAATQLRYPDRYLIDPDSPPAQQAAQQKGQAAQQQAAAQQGLLRLQFLLEKYKVDAQSATDALKVQADLAEAEAQLTLDASALEDARYDAQVARASGEMEKNEAESKANGKGA